MSNILNKSSHPVHVNRIRVRVWRLRDEIEKAISIRMDESNEQKIELDISDISDFYTRIKKSFKPTPKDALEDDEDNSPVEEAAESSDDTNAEVESEAETKDEESSDEDEAAKLAEMMLADADKKDEDTSKSSDENNIKPKQLSRILPDEDKVSTGFAFLSDIDMTKILTFSKSGFTIGQNICIEFLIPNSFIMSGEVVGSNHVGRNSKIISKMKPDYRIMTAFSFLFENERDNLRTFLQSVEPDIPPPPKKLKRPDDDGSDDEFEDLGF